MRMLDLFAGIGGFSLAGHWMGWETIAFVEWDQFNQKVLAKNFPGVPIHGDIREFDATQYNGTADIICGGFPCQPFSTAGKREGTADDRYLWPEMLRVIREVQPEYVVGENVNGLISMDSGSVLEQILLDLEGSGYAVQPFVIPACATGAPHRRDRVWILGKLASGTFGQRGQPEMEGVLGMDERLLEEHGNGEEDTIRSAPHHRESGQATSHLDGARLSGNIHREQPSFSTEIKELTWGKSGRTLAEGFQWRHHWLEAAFSLCRVDDGIPAWLDRHRTGRLKALGNAIVPQVAYQIFKSLTT